MKYINKTRRLFYVYDRRTTMHDYDAAFKSVEDAKAWAIQKFGEFAFITDRKL